MILDTRHKTYTSTLLSSTFREDDIRRMRLTIFKCISAFPFSMTDWASMLLFGINSFEDGVV